MQKAMEAYKLWQGYFDLFPKPSKFSLGVKIDSVFIELIEAVFMARYSKGQQKGLHINAASAKLNLLQFLIQVAWEIKAIDAKQFSTLVSPLNGLGNMIGGWQKYTNETPSQ